MCDRINAESMDVEESPMNDTCEEVIDSGDTPVKNKRIFKGAYVDKGVQVTSGDLGATLCTFIKSEKDLMTMIVWYKQF